MPWGWGEAEQGAYGQTKLRKDFKYWSELFPLYMAEFQAKLKKQQPAQTRDLLAPISGTLKVWYGFRSGWIQQLARNLSPFFTCWLHFALSIGLCLHHSDVGPQSSHPCQYSQ